MKRHIGYTLMIGVVLPFLVGCAQTQPPLYHWGNYVSSSTNYGMQGHQKEVLEKYITELEIIINESEQKDQRVAPGLYAEYAQLLYETNKKEQARKYFSLEKQSYPESTQFINGVIKKLYGETI